MTRILEAKQRIGKNRSKQISESDVAPAEAATTEWIPNVCIYIHTYISRCIYNICIYVGFSKQSLHTRGSNKYKSHRRRTQWQARGWVGFLWISRDDILSMSINICHWCLLGAVFKQYRANLFLYPIILIGLAIANSKVKKHIQAKLNTVNILDKRGTVSKWMKPFRIIYYPSSHLYMHINVIISIVSVNFILIVLISLIKWLSLANLLVKLSHDTLLSTLGLVS